MQKSASKGDLKACMEMADVCVLGHLRSATRAVTQYYDECLRSSGLRSTQFGLLASLRVLAPVTISAMAAASGMDRTTLTRNLKPLIKSGYVRSGAGEDRREREISLTSRGQAVVRKHLPCWQQAQARMARALGGRRMQRLFADLAVTVDAAKR